MFEISINLDSGNNDDPPNMSETSHIELDTSSYTKLVLIPLAYGPSSIYVEKDWDAYYFLYIHRLACVVLFVSLCFYCT